MELVQGEGGVVALDADYVAKAAAFCKERDILVIVDEVQTGVGRTGKFLACEHFGLKPDIITLAKGLGGGLPIGAVVMNRKVAAHMQPGSHGSTFGGNPVCCAGALAVMETMDDAFMANVNARAAQLRAGLAKLPHVQEVSGLGLMAVSYTHLDVYKRQQYNKPGFLELGVSPEQAPDTPTYVKIHFEKGIPTAVDGKEMESVELVEYLNKLGGANGIGLLDIVENRLVGMKSRGVYETPGGAILYKAHDVLETITLDKESMHFKAQLAQKMGELVYNCLLYTSRCV